MNEQAIEVVEVEAHSQEIVRYEEPRELSVAEIKDRVNKVRELMRDIMVPGKHYGTIPGVEKPSLFKPGAELLGLVFRLAPRFKSVVEKDGVHREYASTCELVHIPSQQIWGSGNGLCSTRESRYAWRQGSRKCPQCSSDAIIKGRAEYGGGWVCFKKKGGCGAKYGDGDQAIESQTTGRVPNEDIADQYNTVVKMADKRSYVAAILFTTGASEIFTQDVAEDDGPVPHDPEPVKPRRQERKAAEPTKAGHKADDFFHAIAESLDQKSLDLVAQALSSAEGLHDDDLQDLRQAWAARRDDLRRKRINLPERVPGEDAGETF